MEHLSKNTDIKPICSIISRLILTEYGKSVWCSHVAMKPLIEKLARPTEGSDMSKDRPEDIKRLGELVNMYVDLKDPIYEALHADFEVLGKRQRAEKDCATREKLVEDLSKLHGRTTRRAERFRRRVKKEILSSPVLDHRIWLGICCYRSYSFSDMPEIALRRVFLELEGRPFEAWKKMLLKYHRIMRYRFDGSFVVPPEYLGFQDREQSKINLYNGHIPVESSLVRGLVRLARTKRQKIWIFRYFMRSITWNGYQDEIEEIAFDEMPRIFDRLMRSTSPSRTKLKK